MSSTVAQLPSDPDSLARVINNHVARERTRTSYWRLMRLLYHYYLMGARHFQDINVRQMTINYNYTDDKGNLFFRSSRLLHIINQFVGHSQAADWSPSVVRSDSSLSAIRERAICQVLLDAAVTPQVLAKLTPDAFFLFWAMGGVGLTGDVIRRPGSGAIADIQAIHPSELMPFPSVTNDRTRVRGVIWERYISADHLRNLIGDKKFEAVRPKLSVLKVSTGETEGEMRRLTNGVMTRGLTLQGTAYGTMGSSPTADTMTELVEIRELWLDGDAGFCDRYVLQSGEAILKDEDWQGKNWYPGVKYIRCLDDGTWHGQGICDLLFGHVREHEKMLSYFLENIRTMSNYDMLVLPQNAFDQETAFKDIGQGLKLVTWNPDPLSENQRPFSVRQTTSGEVPGKVAMMLDGLISQLAFPEILQGNAPGRVDSTSGLEFLDAQARKSLNAPVGNLQAGFGQIYQSLALKAIKVVTENQDALPIAKLTPELAGLVIQPQGNKVTLGGSNPIPDVSRLAFTVKNAAPKNPAALKQEAREFLQMGLMTVEQFQYYCIQNGIDVAMPLNRTRNAYEKAVRNLIILFNDGATPGEVVITQQSNVPAIDLMVLEEFMAGLTFQAAEPAVQDAFTDYYQTIQTQLGVVLPAGYQNPDDYVLQRSADIASAPAPQGPVTPNV